MASASLKDKGLDVLIACHIREDHEELIITKSLLDENNNNQNNFVDVKDDFIILEKNNSNLDKKILKLFNITKLDFFDIASKKDVHGRNITSLTNGISGQYKSIYFDKKYDKIFTIYCPIYELLKNTKQYKNNLEKQLYLNGKPLLFNIFTLCNLLNDNGSLYISFYDKVKPNEKDLQELFKPYGIQVVDKQHLIPLNTKFYIMKKDGDNPNFILIITKNKIQKGGDMNLYSPNRYGFKPRVRTGFSNIKIAKQTLKNIKKYDKNYQKQVVITMYNRAKFHPHRTKFMEQAMKVFSNWMKKNYITISRTKKKNKK